MGLGPLPSVGEEGSQVCLSSTFCCIYTVGENTWQHVAKRLPSGNAPTYNRLAEISLADLLMCSARRRSANDIITAKTGVPTTLMVNRRRETVDAGGKRTDVGKGPGETLTSLLHHTSSTRRRASETAIEFSLRSTSTAEGDRSPTPDVWALEGKRGAPRPTNHFRRHSGVAGGQQRHVQHESL